MGNGETQGGTRVGRGEEGEGRGAKYEGNSEEDVAAGDMAGDRVMG